MTEPRTSLDEYLARYLPIRHRHLLNQLNAGEADAIAATAQDWHNASNILYTLADDLTAGLVSLREHWTGEAGDAFVRRMFTVVARILELADEAAAMRTGLSMMAGMLAVAKTEADLLPDENLLARRFPNPVLDLTYGRAPRPTGVDHAAPAVVGPADGYIIQTWEQVHTRLAQIVAGLAHEYHLVEHNIWYGPRPQRSVEPPPVPTEPETAAPTALQASARPPVTPLGGAVPVPAPESTNLTTNPAANGAADAGARPIPPMGLMGAAAAPGYAGDPRRGTAVAWRDDETSWSKDEHASWVDDPDAAPPPIVGDPRTRASDRP